MVSKTIAVLNFIFNKIQIQTIYRKLHENNIYFI